MSKNVMAEGYKHKPYSAEHSFIERPTHFGVKITPSVGWFKIPDKVPLRRVLCKGVNNTCTNPLHDASLLGLRDDFETLHSNKYFL